MRKMIIGLIIVMSCLILMAGCAAYSVAPVTGFIYSDVQAPAIATSNPTSSKVGKAECESILGLVALGILGLVALGDASIEAAMKDGGITKVHHVDYETFSVLGVYARFTLIVYGE